MIYRIAKPADAGRLAEIHHLIKDVNDNGIFVLMGRLFLKQYYKLILTDPYAVCICAEDQGRIMGYTFSLLDSERHRRFIMKHKMRLVVSALGTMIKNPSIIKKLWLRYHSLAKNDGTFIAANGARGGFWGWDPENKDSISSFEMHNNFLKIIHLLGVEKLDIEVDTGNKHVYKFHRLNGAVVTKTVTLPDGRERAFMTYDLTKPLKY